MRNKIVRKHVLNTNFDEIDIIITTIKVKLQCTTFLNNVPCTVPTSFPYIKNVSLSTFFYTFTLMRA